MRTAIAAFAFTLIGVGAPAAAHPLGTPDEVAKGSNYCVKVKPTVADDDNGDGSAGARTSSNKQDCQTRFQRGSTSIAHRMWIYHSATSSGTGAVCVAPTGWFYNTRPTFSIYSDHAFGEDPPCGRGYYWTVVVGKVYVDGDWRGGKNTSPRHYFNP